MTAWSSSPGRAMRPRFAVRSPSVPWSPPSRVTVEADPRQPAPSALTTVDPNDRHWKPAEPSDEEAHDATRHAAQAALLRERVGKGGALRERLLGIFDEVARDPRKGPESVTSALRSSRELSSGERRFVSDAVHDLVRLRRRLGFLAGSSSSSASALLDAWLADQRDPRASEARLSSLTDPRERLAVSASFPDFLVEKWVAEQGLEQARALCSALNQRAPLTVRANRVRCTRERLAARLTELGIASHPGALAPDALVLETRQNVYSMAPFRDGWMELQDEGSQLIAELVAPPPGGTVIDACAGAGGKTLALGALLANRGRIYAYDVGDERLEELRRRARRAGLTNVQATVAPKEGPPPTARPAPRVLLDVPCSGTGALRRNPEGRWRLSPRDLHELVRKQRAILEAYAPLVSDGGRLVYATCSILREENDDIVAAFLAAHDDFEPVPAKEILGRERALRMGDGEALRLLPHVHHTDGFYARVLRRRRGA